MAKEDDEERNQPQNNANFLQENAKERKFRKKALKSRQRKEQGQLEGEVRNISLPI
jgi:hypothetical protein